MTNFDSSTGNSMKMWDLIGFFCPEYVMFELKSTKDIFHDTKERRKIWRGIDLPVQNWHDEFNEFWPEHFKVSNVCTLIGCFWPEYMTFELRKYRYLSWHWRVMQKLKGNWLASSKVTCMGNLTNFGLSTLKSQKVTF